MSQLLTLSRAARLVGVSRAVLQKRIRNGELSTFEGRLEVAELLRVYPQTQLEETEMLDRVQQIMEQAVNKVVWKKTEIPEADILAARVATLHSELGQAKSAMSRQLAFVDEIEEKLRELTKQGSSEAKLKDFQTWFVQSRRERVQPVNLPDHFGAKDAFLRIMAADVKVLPSGHEFLVEGRDSILDAALFSGCNLNYGCSDGSCGLCKARIVSGKVKEVSIPNFRLSKAELESGLLLMCCNTAVTDLVIEADEPEGAKDIPRQKISVRVKEMDRAGKDTWVVHLRTPRNKRLRFLAGQYATLQVGDEPAHELHIASCP
ncbi:MAG: 2Fe-2S iron-sulfur cluster-binding protein, partial [Gammaproteobacteria bacterium]